MSKKVFLALAFVITIAIIEGQSTCRDTNYRCSQWRAYCRNYAGNRYYRTMAKQCRQTCGFCRVTTNPGSSTCIDRHSSCGYWSRTNECTKNPTYMKTNCRKSCKLCTTSPCNDFKKDCGHWARKNYCTSGRFVAYMKKTCKKSCNICGTTKVKKISTTTTTTITTTKKKIPPPPIITTAKATTTIKKKILPPPITTTTTTPKTPQNVSCGVNKRSKIASFIVDGQTAQPNVWPWQTGHYYYGDFHCGGTLITPQFIVTAAHCLEFRNVEGMSVRVGDHKRDTDEEIEQEIEVFGYLIHEDYNSEKSFDNDIALIKLNRSVDININVNVACLPDDQVDINSECYVTGWGKMESDGTSVNVLQEANLPVVSNYECGKRNVDKEGNSRITENMLCAGKRQGISSGCHGDSGGPFVCKSRKNNKWYLQGAVSWGSPKCDNKDKYTVFARISKYIKWIKENIRD